MIDLSSLPERTLVTIDVPRFGFIKRDHHGGFEFLSPLPCPFNYGSVPDSLSPDGDPIDALILGPRLELRQTIEVPVLGAVDFVDNGALDPKWICSPAPLKEAEVAVIHSFFLLYAQAKRASQFVRFKRGETAFRGISLREQPPRKPADP